MFESTLIFLKRPGLTALISGHRQQADRPSRLESIHLVVLERRRVIKWFYTQQRFSKSRLLLCKQFPTTVTSDISRLIYIWPCTPIRQDLAPETPISGDIYWRWWIFHSAGGGITSGGSEITLKFFIDLFLRPPEKLKVCYRPAPGAAVFCKQKVYKNIWSIVCPKKKHPLKQPFLPLVVWNEQLTSAKISERKLE